MAFEVKNEDKNENYQKIRFGIETNDSTIHVENSTLEKAL